MATIVSSTEFRSRMGAMLALADRGEQVVIKRRSSPSYVLEPAEYDYDEYFTPAMLNEIDGRMLEIEQGQGIVIDSEEDMKRFFESL